MWYPQLQRTEARQLPEQLKQLPVKSWLHVALSVQAPSEDGFGMHGSGMFIVNPPWILHSVLQEAMPYLAQHLGQGEGTGYTLEHQEN